MPRPKPTASSRPSVPRNYFSRREQYRLLLLVGVLFGVVWAMNEARQPKNWYWLTGRPGEEAVEGEATSAAVEEAVEEQTPPASTGRRTTPLSPDVFEIPREGPPDLPELEGDFFSGVRPDYVQMILDDRPINRGSEYHAFYHLLALLRDTPLEELEEASLGEVGYRQLDEQPQEYRAQLVNLNAIVRRVERNVAPPGNEYGIEEYYRVYMEPVGGPREMMMAIFLELPESFPTEGDFEAQIEFTGFFYKREPYQSNAQANHGIAIAPLLLAKKPHWIPPPPKPEPVEFKLGYFVVAVAGTCLLAVMLAGAAWFYSQKRSPQAEKYALTSRVRGEDIAKPGDDEVLPSPGESLARLAEAEMREPGGGIRGDS